MTRSKSKLHSLEFMVKNLADARSVLDLQMKYPKFDVTLDLPWDDDKIKNELDFLLNMSPHGQNCRLGVRLFPPAHPLASSEASELISKALHLVSYFVIPEATSGVEFCQRAGFIQDLAMQFDQGPVPLQAEIASIGAVRDIVKIASAPGVEILVARVSSFLLKNPGLYNNNTSQFTLLIDEVARVAKEYQLVAAYGAIASSTFRHVATTLLYKFGYNRLIFTGSLTAETIEALMPSCEAMK